MHHGSCLCGAVRIEVAGEFEHAPEACHCTACRKHTGHHYVGVNVRRDALSITGADNVTWYRSSEKVRRGFCALCGSTLFWDPRIEGYAHISIAMGVFALPTRLQLSKHIFVEEKGDYYTLDDGLPQAQGF